MCGTIRRFRREGFMLAGAACLAAAGGCYEAISIQPSCPAELAVGESGSLQSGARNAGQIATFLWEVFPAEAGRIADPTDADTTFTAVQPGTATLRLTASDGLFQVISQCETVINDE
ncbi:MAG: hypothetical protein FLDDKLPJ_02110 [Phycisphaerae bacterium]|nr:hypothetical protein [Phycisphaerae bacterium]